MKTPMHVKTKPVKLMLVFSLAFVAWTSQAREITSAEAGRAAAAWVRRDSAPLGAKLSATDAEEVLTTRDGDTPIFHVVRLSGGGVVVTSAESGITPVVAFFDGDAPTEGDGNPLWDILSADMAERTRLVGAVREAATTGGTKRMLLGATAGTAEPFAAEESAWAELLAEDAKPSRLLKASSVPDASGQSDLRVAPLVTTTWGQLSGAANYYTPPYDDGNPDNYPCGCLATAGAQIANYWRFPTNSCEQVERECFTNDVPQNFSTMGGTYDWANMPSDFSNLNVEQKQAIGKLCYDFGVASQMDWTVYGSGAISALVADAFREFFGYAAAMSYAHPSNVMPADFVERAVLANLDAKRPVVLGILVQVQGGVGGHAVVADGYGYQSGTRYTHLNLGWNGVADAWYNIPEASCYLPTIGEEGPVSTMLIGAILGAIYNIHPTETGELLTGRVLDKNGKSVAGAIVTATCGDDTASATTDEKGIYAVCVPYGGKTWSVSATACDQSGSRPAYVWRSISDKFIEWIPPEDEVIVSGAIGNSWGNDITLGVDEPALSFNDALDTSSLVFTTGGSADWFVEASGANDGEDVARSGSVSSNEVTWLETTVNGPGIISFWWNVSSEPGYDWLEFYVDGTLESRIGGTNETWASMEVAVNGYGEHTLRWRYVKNTAGAIGADCGWVDQVVWTPTYNNWAWENGVTGAWDAKDALGIYNVFRYVFDVPSGEFENPPIIDIAVEDGKVVVKTPPVMNAVNVTVSIEESSDVGGTADVVSHTLEEAAAGLELSGSSRFYRLSAEVTEKKSAVKTTIEVTPPSAAPAQFFKVKFGE